MNSFKEISRKSKKSIWPGYIELGPSGLEDISKILFDLDYSNAFKLFKVSRRRGYHQASFRDVSKINDIYFSDYYIEDSNLYLAYYHPLEFKELQYE